MLHERELLFLPSSHRMPCEVWRSVNDGLCAFKLQRFTAPWSSELKDALQDSGGASWEMLL